MTKKKDPRDSMPWGHYVVTKGPLKGQVVYYEDDDGRSCIIFPESFLSGYYYVVPPSWLRPATVEERSDDRRHPAEIATALWGTGHPSDHGCPSCAHLEIGSARLEQEA